MGIGVPISKVLPDQANQAERHAAKPKGGGVERRKTVAASHGAMREESLRERSGAECGAKRQPRSDTGLWSDAATRSDGEPGSAGETQSEAQRRRDAATRSADETRSGRESDSSTMYDGGAIFGQPQERKPGFAAGSQGPKRVGKAGVKVRRVARVRTKVMASGPIEGPRGPECGDAL